MHVRTHKNNTIVHINKPKSKPNKNILYKKNFYTYVQSSKEKSVPHTQKLAFPPTHRNQSIP